MKTLNRLVLVVGCVTLFGCGDGETSSFASGLADEKKLSEVTATEQESLCNDYGSWLEARTAGMDLTGVSCTLQGVSTTSTTAGCEAAVAACKANPSALRNDDLDQAAMECARSEYSTCDATVGELETCINDSLDAISVLQDISCADADRYSPEDRESLAPSPSAACVALDAKCPDLG